MDCPKRNDVLSYIIIGLLVAILGAQLVIASKLEKPVSEIESSKGSFVYEDTLLFKPLIDSMSFAWFNPNAHLEKVAQYFTEQGLEKFKVYHSQVLQETKSSQEVHQISLSGHPKIIQTIDRNGGGSESHYKVPVIITYQMGSRARRLNAVINVALQQSYTPQGGVEWRIHDLGVAVE